MKGLFGFRMVTESHMPYLAMLFIQFVYAGMALFSKAAIDKGMNPFVFVVYRQAFASFALAPIAFFLERDKAPPLSFKSLCRIFLASLCGYVISVYKNIVSRYLMIYGLDTRVLMSRISLSLNLYYVALNHTSATFAAATTNVIPTITFVMAVLLRIESISVEHLYGVAKVLGSIICVSGALVFAFVKGPTIKFMNWYPTIENKVSDPSVVKCGSKMEWVKGSLIMLSANTAWSLWLILQGPIIKRYPAKLRLTALQCFFSCIQSAILAIVFERNPSSWKLGWDVHLLSVAYCGIIVSGITYWLQVWAIEKKGPVFTAMFTPLALVITAIFSAFLWKETLHLGSHRVDSTRGVSDHFYTAIYYMKLVFDYGQFLCSSVGGAILLVGGLYSVLWGMNKEERTSKTNGQRQETKEVPVLERITHQ
ncbi:hypothetical protein HHK36_007958 [Tetracentron sinense]|uniref:EamA domain-containing protein n=1 Tax=Tetracentron sinense TaxID=13715 RepID=A0A834ZI67_TETSI|nr:hypothetical protein HHK36_007958 [Tetracentron sinense]